MPLSIGLQRTGLPRGQADFSAIIRKAVACRAGFPPSTAILNHKHELEPVPLALGQRKGHSLIQAHQSTLTDQTIALVCAHFYFKLAHRLFQVFNLLLIGAVSI
jgi:uncharacterized integral membrane protein